MEWIFYIGGLVVYYLYKAYQQEKEKNVNKPLTPVNKPIKQAPKKTTTPTINKPLTTTTTQKAQPKTLEEIWRELKEAANREEYGNYEPEKNILDTQSEPWKDIKSIEYENVKAEESLDKIPFEEGGARLAPSTVMEYQEPVKAPKYLSLNGKKISPKDAFLASIIWERKY